MLSLMAQFSCHVRLGRSNHYSYLSYLAIRRLFNLES